MWRRIVSNHCRSDARNGDDSGIRSCLGVKVVQSCEHLSKV